MKSNGIKLLSEDLKNIIISDDGGIIAKLLSEPNEDGKMIEMRVGTNMKIEYKDPSHIAEIHSVDRQGDKPMDLSNTIAAMLSDNYKHRFWAEYAQTKIRYEKLHKMIVQIEAGTCDFQPDTPLEVLKEQARYMGMYLHTLEIRAEAEKIHITY